MAETYLTTSGTKASQIAILVLSVLFFCVFTFFLVTEYSISMLFLVVIQLATSVFLNLFLSKCFDVILGADEITIANIWKRKTYKTESLVDINEVHFYLPYPLNPFIKLKFVDSHAITKLSDISAVYFSKGGLKEYLSQLKSKVIRKG